MTQPTASQSSPLRYRIQGMDCASCARKIEDMVTRLPGADAPQVNFSSQMLTVTLDETRTPRNRLEANIRTLGYAPSLRLEGGSTAQENEEDYGETAHNHGAEGHTHALEESKAWYATRQAKLVFLTGGLASAAWLFGLLEPQIATWGFIVATLIGTYPLAKRAFAAARFGNPWTIEMLVTLAAIGAIGINESAEAVVVVFFFMIGELLEGVAAGRARAGIKSLAALTPKTALVIDSAGILERIREIPADQLEVGQLVRVQPGGRVPCDGMIVKGASSLDDSPVTGESVPVGKAVGDFVYAGSINGDAVIDVQVTKAAGDNTIARIIKLVEEAEGGKGQHRQIHRPLQPLLDAGRGAGQCAGRGNSTAVVRWRLARLAVQRRQPTADRLPVCPRPKRARRNYQRPLERCAARTADQRRCGTRRYWPCPHDCV
jgi:Zn2+/Cd2+-exporting ATPase